MNDCMTFPDTVEEFMERYKVVDTEHIYTNGSEFVPIFRMKQWFEHLQSAPPDTTTHGSNAVKKGGNDEDRTSGDCISRRAAKDIFTELYGISAIGSVFDKYEWADICETTANELPPIQPKGTRLSTVCLLCKKPAVTFNTEDDIPYTNYSYCEDCLRKGLKLLREQKKNSQAQPERKTGRWIPDGSELGIKCNKCGKSFSDYVNAGTGYMFLEETPNFCPNCCEDMRGKG